MKLPALGLPTADDYLPGHGDPSWGADHYDLDLTYEVVRNRLRGRATITATALEDLDRVVLDLSRLHVSKVTLDGGAPAKYAAPDHQLVVTPTGTIAAGTSFTLQVVYAGTPKPLVERHHGDAGWEELEDGVIVAGQPHGAPTWFPCNDRPDDKASYTLSITAPQSYTVVSNGLLADRKRGGSTVRWRYEQQEPMATYLATVQLGRYDVRELGRPGGVPVLAAVPELDRAREAGFEATFGRNAEMLEVFAGLFGDYPFSTYTVVVTADDLEIPLESQSLSTFGANFCTGEWDAVRLVAHELAHQWFGNAVTLRGWRDIWLHEGFACYAEWLWSEHSGGEPADHHARLHHARLADLDQDLLLADPGPELMFDDRVYKRGALTLHALRLTVGDEAFLDVLSSWVAAYAGGSVTTADFAAHVAARTGHDRDALDGLLEAWLEATELPALPALP